MFSCQPKAIIVERHYFQGSHRQVVMDNIHPAYAAFQKATQINTRWVSYGMQNKKTE